MLKFCFLCVVNLASSNSYAQLENCDLVIPPFFSNDVYVTHQFGDNSEIPIEAGTYYICDNPNPGNVAEDPVVYLGVWDFGGPVWNPFVYTLNFSKPILNMKFIMFGGEAGLAGVTYGAENFVFEAVGSEISLLGIYTCNDIIEEDTLYLGANSLYQGSGLYEISFDCPVYTFSIRGKGGGSGSGFKICSNSIITPNLWARVSGDSLVCPQDSVLFEAFGGEAPYTFSYTMNGGPTQTLVSNEPQTWVQVPSAAGVYTYELLQVSDGADSVAIIGCNNSHTVEVLASPLAQFSLDPNEGTAPFTVQATNLSQNAVSYVWTMNNNSLNINCSSGNTCPIQISNPGTYEIGLVATNSFGCTDNASATINAFDGFQIVVPNVFTPNNDGVNDFFSIQSNQDISCEYVILNRWGVEVTKGNTSVLANTPTTLWDAKAVSDGVYFYRMKIKNEAVEKELEGFVTVVK